MVPVAVGVDFGTSNSVVAIANRSGQVQVRRFETQVGAGEAYRSALLFFREGRPPNATLGHISGPDALLRAMDIDADHRFLQSFKTHLSSATLQDVYLLGRRFLLEELIGVLLKDILPAGIGDLPVVCGRPVVFAGERPNEALALERLTNAYRSAGVAHVDFAYERLGAAYWYARTIQRQATVLVADFGGGTSDFSVMRFDLGGARMRPRRCRTPGSASPATPSIFASSTIWFRLGSARVPVIGPLASCCHCRRTITPPSRNGTGSRFSKTRAPSANCVSS
jgi:hypothetical chaperone protein